MTLPLSQNVALITGGSRGIGAAIVRRLTHDGAAVAFTYAASEDKAHALVAEIEAGGGQAIAIRADATDADAVRRAVDTVAKTFGRLDILVNNAGILKRGDVAEFSLDDFDHMIAVNVRAAFVAVQAAVPHMKAGSRIVNVGSVAGERAGFPGASVYSMTKGAIAALARGLARDLGPRGITINTVQPGPTATDMNPDDSIHAILKSLMALGRIGQDVEVANFVAFLVSGAASFVTGAALTVDGGYLA